MAVRTIVGIVVETETAEEDVVSIGLETERDTYLVTPPEMAEELLDLVGHRLEVTGTIAENEQGEPTIDVDSYVELFDEDEDLDEEEEEEEGAAGRHRDEDEEPD